MKRSFTIVALLDIACFTLLLSVCGVYAQGSSPEDCPVLGSNIQSRYSQSNRERLFMNFGAPAQCNGTVTSWRYCSYNEYQEEDDECDDAERYTSVFLVYRQTGASTYEPVPGSKRSVTLTLRCPSHGGFRCDRVTALSQSDQFTIQENDIVAACLKNTPIRVVGEESSSASNQVYQYNVRNYQQCSTSQLESIDVQNNDFTSNNGRFRLHLYAETNSAVAQCSGGSNPPPFTASVSSGTYLNTASPITCTNTITSWHYCYYPSAASDSQLTYTATVGVWILNTATNQYELLLGSNYTLSLVQPASTPAKIFCKTEVLQPENYVRVQTGDVTGVSLPTSNPLPIVASGATGYNLMAHTGLNAPMMLLMSDLSEASSMALHLYPTIEFIPTEPPTTTQPPTTIEGPTTTETPTTTEAPMTILAPTATLGPTTTMAPMTTEAPMITLAPTATLAPITTQSPTTTLAPMATLAPMITLAPTATLAPTTTQSPTTTLAPMATLAPMITLAPTTTQPPTTTQSPMTTQAPTTTQASMTTEVLTTTETPMTTKVPTTTEETTTILSPTVSPPASTTEATATSQLVATTTDPQLPPDATGPGTTDDQATTTPSNNIITQESKITEAQEETTTAEGDDSTTALVLENTGGGGIDAGDLAAIVLGVLILIVVILVVAGVITYKMKVCGGPGKKSSVRYNATNEEVQLEHNTLLRYTTRPRAPKVPLPGLPGDGPVHNIAPLYESVEEDRADDALPYEEPTSTLIINQGSRVYYTPIGAGASAAEYSTTLEQFVEGKELEEVDDPYYSPATKESELYDQLHRQGITMIRDRDIEITGVLGEGHFGSVQKGMWRDQNGFILQAAIKTMKPGAGEEDKVKFLQEATIMAQFKHSNVITLYGVVSSGGTVMIVVELLSKGDLKNYLETLRPDPGQLLPSFTPRSLLAFCQQVALGMQYLASKGFVHRDLAARNILLSEGGICKIADFGMSRDLADDDYYVSQGGKVPIKWTAPEAIHFRKYSTASDIWSYGCLLYEIWSVGHRPFGAMNNPEVIAKVDSGYRLPPPPGCPQAIYKTMIDCWNPNSLERPGFRDILLSLLEDEQTVLSIPNDIGSNSLAAVLGAPLEAGFNMYTDLQTTYYNREVTTSL